MELLTVLIFSLSLLLSSNKLAALWSQIPSVCPCPELLCD